MPRLEDVSTTELKSALERVTAKKPTQRLLAAIAYKNGITQTELAEWHGVERKTIYNWLTRLEAGLDEDVLHDDHRSGRPHKLDPEQRQDLREALHRTPPATDWDAVAWTPALVQGYVRAQFGVDYSVSSCRRLLRAAGLRYRSRDAVRVPESASGPDGEAGTRGFWVPE